MEPTRLVLHPPLIEIRANGAVRIVHWVSPLRALTGFWISTQGGGQTQARLTFSFYVCTLRLVD